MHSLKVGNAGTHLPATTQTFPWTQTTPLKAAMDGRFHHDIHMGDVVAWPTNLGWMMGPWLVFGSTSLFHVVACVMNASAIPWTCAVPAIVSRLRW